VTTERRGGRVIVVGSVNVDLVVTADRLPAPGETVTGGRFGRSHGGKGANQAVAAARLGAPTAFVGAIGADRFGTEARDALAAEGVDLDALVVVHGEPTGVAVIVVDAAGENLIAVASGANAALEPSAAAASLARLRPGPGDAVLVGHEIPTATAAAALRAARAAGATTILNPAPAGTLSRATFGLADVLTPNRGELAALVAGEGRRTGRSTMSSGGRGDEAAAGAATLIDASAEGDGVREAVLVSLGRHGAVLVRRDGRITELPAAHVQAVDAVGAGDALNGALAAALAGGHDLETAARRAVVAATLAVTRPGARGGMPTEAELEAALDAQR
jgi:ribokinase